MTNCSYDTIWPTRVFITKSEVPFLLYSLLSISTSFIFPFDFYILSLISWQHWLILSTEANIHFPLNMSLTLNLRGYFKLSNIFAIFYAKSFFYSSTNDFRLDFLFWLIYVLVFNLLSTSTDPSTYDNIFSLILTKALVYDMSLILTPTFSL